MNLRDLTVAELRDLQRKCQAEFARWKNGNGQRPKTDEDVWNYAFSTALRLRLALEVKP